MSTPSIHFKIAGVIHADGSPIPDAVVGYFEKRLRRTVRNPNAPVTMRMSELGSGDTCTDVYVPDVSSKSRPVGKDPVVPHNAWSPPHVDGTANVVLFAPPSSGSGVGASNPKTGDILGPNSIGSSEGSTPES